METPNTNMPMVSAAWVEAGWKSKTDMPKQLW